MNRNSLSGLLKEEVGLLTGLVTLVCFLLFGKVWLTNMSGTIFPTVFFLWLFLTAAANCDDFTLNTTYTGHKLGEPYGTLILTLSVISIEVVMISAVMLTGDQNPTLGRDMMFAVLMIVLNGLIGISLLCGGFRHLEQVHNLQGANTFLIVLIPLSVLSLILPDFTLATERGTYSTSQMIFGILASVSLYGTFLAIQTMRHQGFFMIPGGDHPEDEHDHGNLVVRSVIYHACLLLASMLPIVLLSKSMAKIIDFSVAELSFPVAFGGVLIAVLVLAPEGVAAIKSATSDKLQRSVNICLGSALATIGLTVPAILLIGLTNWQQSRAGPRSGRHGFTCHNIGCFHGDLFK